MPEAKWREFRLGDHVRLLSGGTPSMSNPAFWGGHIPWVSCKDMKSDRLWDSEDHVTVDGAERGTRLVPAGTILMVVRGMILAKHLPVAIAMRPLTFNQDLKAIECTKDIDRLFLYYLLRAKSYEIMGIADEAAHGTKRLQTDRLLGLQICLPHIAIQRKIASVLSAYDDLIENNTRRIAVLEEMAQAIYREWFVEFRCPGHEDMHMVESQLGLMPEQWRLARLGDVVELARIGVNPSKYEDEVFAHYSIPAFDDGKLPVMEPGANIKSSKFLVPTNAVLVSKINPKIPRVWWPVLTHSERAIASTEFLVLIPRTGIPTEFVFALCQVPEFLNDLATRAGGTSTSHQRVKPDDFMNLPIIHPDRAMVARFAELAAPLFSCTHALRLRNKLLREARDLLLPKLVSGETVVEGLEIEPEPGGVE